MFYTMLNAMIMLSLVIGTGFYLQKKDILNDDVRDNFTAVLLQICLPSMFLNSLQLDATPELMKSAFTMTIVAIFMHLLFLLVAYIFTKIIRAKDNEKGVIIVTCAFKNLSYIGLPIVMSLFPDNNPAFYMSLYCLPFNVIVFALAPKLLSDDANVKLKLGDFFNNINISIIVGILLFVFGIKFPKPIGNAFSTISQMTIPLSLFLTGALLTKSNIKTVLKEPLVMITSAFSLIILPLIFLGTLSLANVDTFTKQYAFIMASLPSGSMAMILTDKYKGNIDLAVKIVLTTTFFSLFTTVLLIGLV